eukprot:GDKJ01017189.1.p1 GENE.GDKJ01017189.1~~GDKJ01017189.1.p1  ORF type:complete len:424 (+),score=106.45 GDKJ01017189.1:23-1294(+)
MASVKAALPFILCMVFFGSMNTILTTWQNSTPMKRKDPINPISIRERNVEPIYSGYDQAVIQTFIMLIGETLCFIVYGALKAIHKRQEAKKAAAGIEDETVTPLMDGMLGITHNRSHPPLKVEQHFLLALPALCDTVGTCLQMAGLAMTSGSTYQMLRGFVIVVTAIFGRVFLGTPIPNYRILAMCGMVCAFAWLGIVTIYLTDRNPNLDPVTEGGNNEKSASLGIILLLIAQIFPATQFILEEKFLSSYALAPTKAVAFEGIFGIGILCILVPILGIVLKGNPEFGPYFQFNYALHESFDWYPRVRNLHFCIMFCIAIFNCMSLAVTRLLNSGMRATLDSLRTVVVWIVCCLAGFEKFNAYKIPGFIVLTLCIFIFNDIIVLPMEGWKKVDNKAEEKSKDVEVGLVGDNLNYGYENDEKKRH